MRKITSIQHVEFWKDKAGKRHSRTYALLDDGTEAVGYGHEFDTDDLVEVFFHHNYGTIKMRKPANAKRTKQLDEGENPGSHK